MERSETVREKAVVIRKNIYGRNKAELISYYYYDEIIQTP
jgi:hypothetical protein